MSKLAFLFPGQGSQVVGMGKDFYDKYDIAKKLFKEACNGGHQDSCKLI